MQPLCRYARALGSPGEGLHAYRVCGLAAVDIAATIGAAAAVGLAAPGLQALAFARALTGLMLLAVALHEAFGVNTRLNAAIFGRPWPGSSGCARSDSDRDRTG